MKMNQELPNWTIDIAEKTITFSHRGVRKVYDFTHMGEAYFLRRVKELKCAYENGRVALQILKPCRICGESPTFRFKEDFYCDDCAPPFAKEIEK